jgi:hypothetical protein
MNKVSFLDRAKSIIKATTKHVLSGAEHVSEEEYLKRAKECDSCIHFIKKDNVCGICGCIMDVKAKWKTSECPKNKW